MAGLSQSSLTQGTTFQVCDVDVPDELLPVLPGAFVISTLMGGRLEAYSFTKPYLVDTSYKLSELQSAEDLRNGKREAKQHEISLAFNFLNHSHPFIGAVHTAFMSHYPLVISPDHIWLLLCQGLANHVLKHAEALRPKFVTHSGKLDLTVSLDSFIKGSPDNDWEMAVAEFAKQVREHIGVTADLITADFSTTGVVEQAAFNITLLAIVQEYFNYEAVTLCGIPRITLEGTAQDWRNLLARFEQFRQFDLAWWVDEVIPTLEEFIHAAEGRVNTDFWNSIYKWNSSSGGPFINGWVVNLFPYLNLTTNELTENPNLRQPEAVAKSWGGGLQLKHFPGGMPSVPFKWSFPLVQQSFEMYFAAGFVGFSQDEHSKALRPEIGWGVMDANAKIQKPTSFGNYPWEETPSQAQYSQAMLDNYIKYRAEVEARLAAKN